MKSVAVLLTVYNRKDVTLKGLRSLYKAIESLGGDYTFDIYMTDDGSTDGTAEAVQDEFPQIQIIKGDGKLFWNGGMLKAWHSAIDSGKDYVFFLWFNDDVVLYEDALLTLFQSHEISGVNSIVSGAFCDKVGSVSYGGWNYDTLVVPNGDIQAVELINGNLVLIPNVVFKEIGILDSHFIHSYGDWEYGIRARKKGFKLVISSTYVGRCERHDGLRKCFNPQYGLIERVLNLYSYNGIYPPNLIYYNIKCYGIMMAIRRYLSVHIRCLFT